MEEFDSKLVICCHCDPNNDELVDNPRYRQYNDNKAHHGTIYYVVNNKVIQPLGKKVKYIDPICKHAKWRSIKSNSREIIWLINCPMYFVLHTDEFLLSLKDKYLNQGIDHASSVLLDILKHAYRVLIKNGKIYIRYHFDRHKSVKSLRISELKINQFLILSKLYDQWKVDLILKDSELPFNLLIDYSDTVRTKNHQDKMTCPVFCLTKL
jgi:hypothetical protein